MLTECGTSLIYLTASLVAKRRQMDISKRILISTTRNFGRSVLILTIIFVLTTFTVGAILVSRAVQTVGYNLKANMSVVAVVDLDIEAMEEYQELTGQWPVPGIFTMEQAEQIGVLPYVKNYNLSVGEFLVSDELERYFIDEYGSFADGMGAWNSFNIRGVSSTELIELEEGVIEITSGRMFSEEEVSSLTNVALVSRGFAYVNHLHIGSTFNLDNIVWKDAVWDRWLFSEEYIFTQESYTFEVVGIYERLVDSVTGDEGIDNQNFEEIDNRIYVPNPVAIKAQNFYMENLRKISPDSPLFYGVPEGTLRFRNIYVLNNFADMESFKEAAKESLPEFHTVKSLNDTDSFQRISTPLETLNWLAVIVLYASIGAAILILSLLLALTMRDRRHEIGTLLALGEKKSKVIAQMMTEVLAVALIAMVLALFAGNILATNISEEMLRSDLIAQEQGGTGMTVGHLEAWGFSGGDVSPEAILVKYDVSLSPTTILVFFVVSIITVIISTVMSMFYIVRLNPKKILM